MELTDATLYETVDVVGAFLQVSSRPGDEEPEFIGNLPNKTEKCYVPPWRKVGLWWLPRIFPSPPLLLQLLIRKLRLAGDWLAHFVCVSMTRWNVWTFFLKKINYSIFLCVLNVLQRTSQIRTRLTRDFWWKIVKKLNEWTWIIQRLNKP